MQRRNAGHARGRICCASRIINAAEIDAAETTNSMPSSGVSDQIGRLVTASKNSGITGDIETEESADDRDEHMPTGFGRPQVAARAASCQTTVFCERAQENDSKEKTEDQSAPTIRATSATRA